MYAGRFAPSPTGPLHFGSLVAALASWLDARAAGGRWQVRIEDLDPPREQPGAAGQILRALESLGLEWDGPVAYQSRRRMLYRDALERLAGKTYACGCSRKEVADSALAMNSAGVYPGTCRNGLPAGKTPRALRMRTRQNRSVSWTACKAKSSSRWNATSVISSCAVPTASSHTSWQW